MEVRANVTLQEKVKYVGKAHTNHTVQIDYYPPFGTDDGFTSTELILVSLASCSGHAIQAILGKMQKTIDAFEIDAVGNRRDEHPTVFTDIKVIYKIKGRNLDEESVKRAINIAEEKICPVWAMLKPSVKIDWELILN